MVTAGRSVPDAVVRQKAADLALKAEHYANAFRNAARIIRTHRPAENTLAHIFDVKADLEDDFAKQLRDDPVGTWEREGL